MFFCSYSVDLKEFENSSLRQNSPWISFVPSRELMAQIVKEKKCLQQVECATYLSFEASTSLDCRP